MTFQCTPAPEPQESYSYSLVTDDYKHIRKHFRRPLTYLQALSPVLLILSFMFNPTFVQYGGWIIAVAVNITAYVIYRILWNKLFKRLSGAVYSLDVYRNHFVLTVDKILTEKQTVRVNFISITQVSNIGTCLLIITNSGKYYVKRDVLADKSEIYATAATLGRKNSSKPMSKREKITALIFLIISIAAFVGAGLIYGYIIAVQNKIYSVFILMMFIFPIISAISLIILSFKGYSVTMHVVISCISAALILVLAIFNGLTRFDSYIPSAPSISYAEECFDIDIPEEYTSAMTYADTPFSRHHYLTIVDFDSTEFRNSVHANRNWLTNPTEYLEDIAIFVNYQRYYYKDADYVMLYNTDKGELNTLPAESGTYHFIAVYYDTNSRDDTLYIVEYDVTYTK